MVSSDGNPRGISTHFSCHPASRANKASFTASREKESHRSRNFGRFSRSSGTHSWLEIPSQLPVGLRFFGPHGTKTPWFGAGRPVKRPEIPLGLPSKDPEAEGGSVNMCSPRCPTFRPLSRPVDANFGSIFRSCCPRPGSFWHL